MCCTGLIRKTEMAFWICFIIFFCKWMFKRVFIFASFMHYFHVLCCRSPNHSTQSHLNLQWYLIPWVKGTCRYIIDLYFKNQAIMYMPATGALGQICVIINHFIVEANGNKTVHKPGLTQCQMKGKTVTMQS